MKIVDLTGENIGRLHVEARIANTGKIDARPAGRVTYRCRCECGRTRNVTQDELTRLGVMCCTFCEGRPPPRRISHRFEVIEATLTMVHTECVRCGMVKLKLWRKMGGYPNWVTWLVAADGTPRPFNGQFLPSCEMLNFDPACYRTSHLIENLTMLVKKMDFAERLAETTTDTTYEQARPPPE